MKRTLACLILMSLLAASCGKKDDQSEVTPTVGQWTSTLQTYYPKGSCVVLNQGPMRGHVGYTMTFSAYTQLYTVQLRDNWNISVTAYANALVPCL